MNKFIMMVGLPGCGKSTYCASHYGNDENIVILSSDAIRSELGFDPGTGHNDVFTIMDKRTIKALQEGKTVIYDATNLSRKRRMPILEAVKKYCNKRECVLFVEPFTVCCERNKKREASAVVPFEAMERMLKSFNVPMQCEGFDSINIIQTEKSSETLADLLDKTADFDQDNKHHSLSLYEHLVKTKNSLFKLIPVIHVLPEDIYEAALYHDIGKLYTKSFTDAKGNKTTEAHYYQHENVGAYIYLSSAIGYKKSALQENQILYTAGLINWHMRPYLNMNPEKRKREYDMLGEKFVNDLRVLHEADHLAH